VKLPKPVHNVLTKIVAQTSGLVSRRSRGLTAALTVMLGGFAATAFGIAPMVVPDPSQLPQHLVTEAVRPSGLGSQLDALAAYELDLYRTDLTRASDTADSLLRRLGINDAAAASFLRTDLGAQALLDGQGGKMIRVNSNAQGELDELVARYAAPGAMATTHFSRLKISRSAEGLLKTTTELVPLTVQVHLGSGRVQGSLFAAIDEARIPDGVASQMAELFEAEVDFHRQSNRGDTFAVLYETLTADGEPITWNVSSGRVLAAEFVNRGRKHTAVWFSDPASGQGAYFDLQGRSKRRSFMGSPLEFSRITSGFAMRNHPVFGEWRQHKGVDYAAPEGTSIRSVGDGVVEFAGQQRGYGNVIEIKHSLDRSTLYAHLSSVDVLQGQPIKQGMHIGAVGSTGWATGPHLHFEFKQNGEQKDPMLIAQASETFELSKTSRIRFSQVARGVQQQLVAMRGLDQTATSFE
jgi:murein DD-endopeptidase MepM/ murein hydrolase activator NlpD